MEKKKFLTFGVIMVVLVALAFVYGLVVGPSGDNLGLRFISKTEYVEGDVGQVIVELRTAMPNNTVIPASCLASIWYPNKTIFIGNQSMANASSGSKYINFTVPSAEGVYEYQAVCSYVGRTYVSSSSFHVSSGFRRLDEDILSAIQIVPQGVTQVEMGRTAAQSWLIESRAPLNLSSAFCSVYRLVNNTREFAAGQLYYYDFASGVPEVNYTNGTVSDPYSSRPLVFDSIYPVGQVVGAVTNVTGAMGMHTDMTFGNAWVMFPGIEQDNWELSLDVTASFQTGPSTFHIILLGTDRDGGRKVSYGSSSNVDPRAPYNAMIVVGVNDNTGTGSRGWARGYSYSPDFGGNWFVMRNSSVNGTRWARTNATNAVGWATRSLGLVKSGSRFSFYINGALIYQWDDTLPESIKSVFLAADSSAVYKDLVDNYDVRVSVSSDYSYGNTGYGPDEYTQLFTYYWTPGIDNTVRGENYVVDCDLEMQRADGSQTLQNLVQYVYVNREGRIRAVIPK